MKLSDLYSIPQTIEQPNAAPVTQTQNTAQPPAVPAGQKWTVVTWFGVLLALILLRVVYELSE